MTKDRNHRLLNFLFTAMLTMSLGIQCDPRPDPEEKMAGIVSDYGQLNYSGLYLVNQQQDTVSLEGVSMFWHQWGEGKKFYNYSCMKWLRDDWKCDVVRAAVAVEHGGYLEHPRKTKKQIFRLIDACIDLGMYVIVDWHSHEAENSTDKAVEFFREVAIRYGNTPNVIYEIYNEPLRVSWSEVVKPYLETVIAAIRENDPDNIILVGSPLWSQNVDEASEDPVEGVNIAYTLHFYAGTHQQWLRDKAQIALDKGLPLWVSEFGTCNADGNGPIDYEETARWFDFMESNRIGWCKWSISSKDETSSCLKPGARAKGYWKPEDLTESGKLIREKIISINSSER